MLWTAEKDLFAAGKTDFGDLDEGHSARHPSIFLHIILPIGEGFNTLALLDTGAPYCIFNTEIVEELGFNFDKGELVQLSTRLGNVKGRIKRCPVIIPAVLGESLEVDVTLLASPDWDSGNFLGYSGFAQRLRFGIDPQSNEFYFGKIA